MGKVIMSGRVPHLTAPFNSILASEFAVGSSVWLTVNGVPTEFLVVHQGNPDSSVYDESCNGTWLLMKDVYKNGSMGGDGTNFANSSAFSYLNGEFFNLLDSNLQNAVMTVAIPYKTTGSSASTVKTVDAKCFFLSCKEVGLTATYKDGVLLDYFVDATNATRIAYLNGEAETYWTRTPYNASTALQYYRVGYDGVRATSNCSTMIGYRPALILPFNAKFDVKTLVFKGVA